MKPEFLIRARTLWQRVGEFSAEQWRRGRDAGRALWRKVTDAPDEKGRSRRIVMLAGGAILVGILAIYALTHIGAGQANRVDVDTRQAVTAIAIQPHEFSPTISLNGQARPERDIHVTAPASGVRILELLVDEGERVRAGQPMARLDTALANAQLRAAQASVAEAQSAAVRARSEYERAESIRDSGALSTEAIEQRRAAAVAADARLAAARAQLQEVNARLGGGYVRAPASGLVIDRSAEVGRSVEGQVLFRIAVGNQLEVAAQVAEADILALAPGQTATFRLVDGSTVEARLSRLPASIDPATRTGEALFALPDDSRVVAGMYLRGEAHLAPREVLAAPQSSILYDAGQAYVYVIGDDNRVRRADVALGARDGDLVQIVSGLDAGQRIVGAGAAFLQHGDEVRTLPPPQADPSTEGAAELRGRAG